MRSVILLGFFATCVFTHEVYFSEKFDDGDAWEDRWIQSTHKSDYGKFILTAGKFFGDEEPNKGIQTSQDAKFYSLSTKFEKFSNKDKPLVLQFSVKHEQNIDCGGGYIKLLDCSVDPKTFNGESSYVIMFGPDICGPGTKKVHVIFGYKGKNLLIKKDIRCKDDVYTHLYTLVVRPDNTYEVLIDNEKAQSGDLEEDWDFLPPKKIKDPEAKKPDDWDDRPKIDDPEDNKPEDWDQPEHTADPDAKKPDDWNDDMDGEWEPPMIDNPDYKGEWKPRQMDNPDYKGPWIHPEIENPEYVPDSHLYLHEEICGIGFDLWQVKSGSIFDNLLVTDDLEHAKKVAEEDWAAYKDAEKKMKEEQDEEERKRAEAEAKDTEPEEDLDDEDMDDEEEEEEEHEHDHEEL